MRGRLLKTLIGLSQHAGLTSRNYVTSLKCPFPLLLSAGPPSHLTLLHRMHLRMIHATASLERHRKSKGKKFKDYKPLPRHHGKHKCSRNARPKRHPCKFKKCFCVGPTYKDNAHTRTRVHAKKRKKCSHYDCHGESGQGPYRRQ